MTRVVQAGLMHPGEIMAIENPEVHLHPSLQLALTEFLIAQSRSGRFLNQIMRLVSDWVIKR